MESTVNFSKNGPFGGPVKPNYPRNCWWLAALSEEVTDKPYGCWILDMPVVLYRKTDGTVVALDNRCVHRWAPLSAGWVEGDRIVCGYHGFQYAPDGACVKIPSQGAVPSKARVRAYRLTEQRPFIWIWMGDADRAATAEPPPSFPWASDPECTTIHGYTPLAANYMMLKENVLDLTHFGYVHRNSIQVTDWDKPPRVEATDKTVTFINEFPDSKLSFIYGVPTGIGMEKSVYRKNWGTFLSPAAHIGAVEIKDPSPAPGARDQFMFRVLHLTTPESPTRTRYWWFQSWDVRIPPEFVAKWQPAVEAGYAEDKDILNHVQSVLSTDPRGADYPEVLAMADHAAVRARRVLQGWLDRD